MWIQSNNSIFKNILHQKNKFSQETDGELVLRNSSCTCPDWFTKKICPHLLACLIKEKKISTKLHWKKPNKRGRKKSSWSINQILILFRDFGTW